MIDMTNQRAIKLMGIELLCIERNDAGCDRDCAKCDLVQDSEELKAAFQKAMNALTLQDMLEKIVEARMGK